MKKYMAILATLFLLLSALSGCIETTQETNKIGILTTIIPQSELIEKIGGDHIDLTIMVPAGESPHSYEPTPEQLIKVAQAEAYFTVGSGVEFEVAQMDTILEQNLDLQVFDCSENITVLAFDQHHGAETHHDEEEDHEEEEDHDHGGTDPHIWTSPTNYMIMAEAIKNGLIELDPANQTDYQENYNTLITNLTEMHNSIQSMLEPYENRSFMTYHPAWGYFGDTYHLTQIAIEEDGKQPGPAGISSIISQAGQLNITTIFVSPQFDTSSAETIAAEINGTVVFANPLTDDYQATITNLANSIVQGFETP